MAPGRKYEPQLLYFGSVPGGLFVSEDGGASFSLVDALWNHATRASWGRAGKAFDEPGLHSVLVDRRDPKDILVAIGCAGCMVARDGGRAWGPSHQGLKDAYMPDPDAEVGPDPPC